MSPPNIQFIGASGLGLDWDTYENGIWQESPNHESNVQYTTNGYTTYGATRLKSPTTNASTWGDYIVGWWSYSSRPTASVSGGYTSADADPYVAVWDCVLGQWLGVEPFVNVGSSRAVYDDGVGNRLFVDNPSSKTNTCIFVPLTADPGDISGWRDYDGPDDWDTWEDGIAAIDMDPISGYGISDYFYPKNVKDSTNYEVPLRAKAISLTEFVIAKFDNLINAGALENPPPYIALWWERTGSQVVRTWFVAKLKDGSAYNYEFVEAANGQATFHSATDPTGQFAIVNLSKQPTNLANWRDYDGPLFASWDEPARHTLVSAVDQVASSVVDVEYYEDTSFWSSIVQNSPGTTIPGTLSRDAPDLLTMNKDPSSSSMNNGTFTSLVPKAAIHMANYTSPYNGWLWSTPSSTNIWQQSYPFTVSSNLDYNTFYTYAPIVITLYSEEIGDIRYWPAYDGPVANWDTYANGVYLLGYLSLQASEYGLTEVPAYAGTTYNSTFGNRLAVRTNIGVETNYNTPASNADSPPYIAVYIHEYHDTQDGYASNAKGWYVFERPSIPAVNASLTYTPYAWPGDTSTGNYASDNSNGYLNNGGDDSSGYIVVLLDEYNDPVGAGGTDHWTKPPYVVYSPNAAPYATTAVQHGSGTLTANRYTNFDLYGWGALRASNPNSASAVIVCSGAYDANVNVEVYRDNALYADGVGDFSSTGTKFVAVTYREPNIQKVPGYDFANGEDMWFVVYHND